MSSVRPLVGDPPEVTSIEPHEGPEIGGTLVTIMGNNFEEEPAVFFGSAEAAKVEFKSEHEILATSSAGNGFLHVTVKTLGGTSEATPADTYTFTEPEPPHKIGGLDVETYCEHLGYHGEENNPTALLKGGIEGLEFAFHNWACVNGSGTTVEIKEKGAAPSMEDMCHFEHAGVASFAYPINPNNAFTWNCYAIQPKVSVVEPKAINVGGGLVTVKGEDLQGASSVDFEGSPGTIESDSATEISVEAPAHSVGTVDAVVTTEGGASTTGPTDRITYVSGAVISKIEPKEGPEEGGTHVKIFGEFLESGSVRFGGAPAKILKESAAELEVEAPAHTAGSVEVEFNGPAGEASGGSENRFTYEAVPPPVPVVTSVSPQEGPAAGGTPVRIKGENLGEPIAVEFGSQEATDVTILGPGELAVKSPPGTGTVDVTVKTAGGTSGIVPADQFVYRALPVVSELEPNEGSTSGGTSVVITGEHLSGASEVKFGTAKGTNVEPKSDTEVVATSPAGAGTVDVVVKALGGASSTGPEDRFTYRARPAVTSISPKEGPDGGETVVTVTGEHLEGASEVKFGSAKATGLEVLSETELKATSPAGAGSVDITVATPGGTSEAVADDQFTYRAQPSVTSLTPNEGPAAGGTTVMIKGAHLEGATDVEFGPTKGTILEIKSESELKAKSPAGTGTQHVTVTSPGGTSAAGEAAEFTYRGVPSVESVNPIEGPLEGGTTVTVKGQHLENAEVKFGGVPATVNQDTSTEVEVLTPAHGAGAVEVCAATHGGEGCESGAYHYIAPPTVSSIAPKEGPDAGNTSVTIKGAHLTRATEVSFGGVAAKTFSIVADTEIVATTPAGTGSVDVAVKTAGGKAVTGAGNEFTYRGVPKVTALSPKEGPTGGHTRVKVSGENLETASQALEVKFGTAKATVISDSADEIEAESPSGTAGAVHATVTTAGGTSASSTADEFTYRGVPTVTGISPKEGPEVGGTTVVVTGTHFEGATEVKFGTAKGTIAEVKSETELTAKSPPGSGTEDVTITTPGGTSAPSSADQFAYRAIPTIGTISPKEGPEAGGTTVIITGTHLTAASEVTFGGATATFTVKSDVEVVAVTPPGVGSVDVAVKTAGGKAVTGAGNEFTYRGVPKVTGLSPKEGPTSGHTKVKISGENLEAASAALEVKFGTTKATVIGDSADEIEVETPSGTAGAVHATVTTAGGTSAASTADEFTYRAVPTVTGIAPNEGPEAGGTTITVTGTHLKGATKVDFGAALGASVEVKSETELTVKSPAGTGTQHVTVTSAGGTSTTSAADEFTYRGLPTVTGIAPKEGPETGGTPVVVTGTHLKGATKVDFGATPGANVEIKSETELTVKSPAGTGTQHVTVTSAGGISTTSAADEFTYRPAPKFTSLNPKTGFSEGGESVTITGEHLEPASQVKFGGALAAIVRDAAGEIEVLTPAHLAATVEVCIITAGGEVCASNAFTYTGPPPPKPALSSLAPSEGSLGGASKVKLMGTNLDGATAVTFGGTAAKLLANSETEVEVETPAHAAGAVEVCVTTGGGTSCKPALYSYVVAPEIATVKPGEGPEAGGTTVTITGEHLEHASEVKFGATSATPRNLTATQLEVTAPPNAPGVVEVCVVAPGGSNCLAGAYTYLGIPSVSSLTPSEGPIAGGTAVTVHGQHLMGASEVKFGSTAATIKERISEAELKVNSPAGTGAVHVVVKTAGGESTASTADEFTYLVAPKVSSVNPKEGPQGGASSVTIMGEHLAHVSKVSFGLAESPHVEARSEGEVRAETPPHAPGTVDVVVFTAGGQSTAGSADHYVYVTRPVIKRVIQDEGSTSGGETIKLIGEHLNGTTAVKFGGVASPEFHIVSNEEVTAEVPAHEAGTFDVVVSTPGGESATGSADQFTYDAPAPPPPKVFSVSPTQGSAAGGTLVTIKGEGFTAPASVRFGGSEGTAVAVASSTEITVRSPAHGEGTVAVVVRTPGGESAGSEASAFTYVPAPATAAGSGAVSAAVFFAPPAPVLGSTGNVSPVSGTVLIKLPGSNTFVPLSALRQIPFGTVIDATHGRVSVTTAGPHGGTQTGEFFDGEFVLTQGSNGLVVATLTGGNFAVCPRHGAASKARHASASATHASSKHVVRKLWANAHGSFSTKGNYAAGAVQGTEWLTEDRCDGTLIRVTRDKVRVTNLVNHRHASVKAGHSYLAKAP